MSEISLRNVSKIYGDAFAAVKDVSLDIADGEFVILVGPSGCGKSTLLRMIVGLEDISEGELDIGGERMNNKAPKDRNLAMVFQNYALYPHLSVRENIAFPLTLAKMDEKTIHDKVEDAAKTLELTEHLDRKPGQLSGGQRQRVAMGRAIVREPNAFLFDEPLSNLDAKLRGQMRTEIARLQKRFGTTTVYVTHDQTEAMTLGDRVVVLRKGVAQQIASPKELYNRPTNLFVAGFIGSPSMNMLPAQLEGDQLKMPFATITVPQATVQAAGNAKRLIAGIRAEYFEDANYVGDKAEHGQSFEATVDVTEWLGSELFAYVPYEVEQGDAGLSSLTEELEQLPSSASIVAELNAASPISAGDTATLWVDARRIMLFDAETGDNLTREVPLPDDAAPAPVAAEQPRTQTV